MTTRPSCFVKAPLSSGSSLMLILLLMIFTPPTGCGFGLEPPPSSSSSSSSSSSLHLLNRLIHNLTSVPHHHATLLLFHAPHSCPLSTAYLPEFNKLQALLHSHNVTNVTLMEIDTHQHPQLTKTFQITTVPYTALLTPANWYRYRQGEQIINAPPPNRYTGYLAALPTLEWLNAELNLSLTVKPLITSLTTPSQLQEKCTHARISCLVLFYAPWCGHCEEFMRYYVDVGAHFAERDDVLVARFDADKAEHRAYLASRTAYNVTGFPTVQLFPASFEDHPGQKPLVFRGERSPARVIDFVTAPSSYEAESSALRWLRDSPEAASLMAPKEGEDSDENVANRIFVDAHERASQKNWHDALRLLLLLKETPHLRKTGTASSRQMWNLLDNVKFNIEQEEKGGVDDDNEEELEQQQQQQLEMEEMPPPPPLPTDDDELETVRWYTHDARHVASGDAWYPASFPFTRRSLTPWWLAPAEHDDTCESPDGHNLLL
ncbi:hypothetical protein PPROV_000864400 [Pycnococcus provasolii]|uniref:Thioredoxin domain-containing protein n=1 Tax=Pycnococcus provasolii TaxID=41880 RepID=A0A830HVX6_9CHLO|nr:hypothetical protein PPROV_000864400 [Pycnococcus provasolii]